MIESVEHNLDGTVAFTERTIRVIKEHADEVTLAYIKHLIKENESLKEDSRMLDCLRGAGVDNWEGYSCAIEMFAGEDI